MALDSFTLSAIAVSIAALVTVLALYARSVQHKCDPDA
jgi:hypothetical protein